MILKFLSFNFLVMNVRTIRCMRFISKHLILTKIC